MGTLQKDLVELQSLKNHQAILEAENNSLKANLKDLEKQTKETASCQRDL